MNTGKLAMMLFFFILGVSNCGFSLLVLFLSVCVGYTVYDCAEWIENFLYLWGLGD